MKHITVIGAGTMGNGIAHVFAMKGYEVNLVDVSAEALQKALATIDKNLQRMVKKARITTEQADATLSRLNTLTALKDGVKKADLVVEAATENMDLKLRVFKEVDQSAPSSAILATNTSSISITKIGAVTSRPEQVIGMHF